MFYDCELPKGFTLGDKFDTSNVTDMACMFGIGRSLEDYKSGSYNTLNIELSNFF